VFDKQAVAHKGAVMVGPPVLREYLINYARPLIYSTALPLTSLLAIRASLRMVYLADAERQRLKGPLRFCFLLSQLVDGCV
jgi:8-amino-7-oxononanoate synthase